MWRSARATASAPSGPATGGIIAAVVAKRCHCLVAVVATTTVMAAWPLIWQDRPALEREVASPSVCCPCQEGREEPAIDQMSTIMVKLEHRG
jgi:hypothetical protein